MLAEEHVIMIGGGIGVTPFASLLLYLRDVLKGQPPVDDRQAQEIARIAVKRIRFIWICKTLAYLEWFLELVRELDSDASTHSWLHMSFFLTNTPKPANLPALPQGIAVHSSDGSGFGTLQRAADGKSNLRVYYCRPALESVLTDYSERHLLGMKSGLYHNRRVGVYFCGPKPLGDTIQQGCDTVNRANRPKPHDERVKLSFEQEVF